VSLILDALKKLEREKVAGEPGVVVVGSVPWGERAHVRRRIVLGAAVVLVVALALAGRVLFTGAPTRQPARPEASGGPAGAVAPLAPAAATTGATSAPTNVPAPPPARRLALPSPAASRAPTPAATTGTEPRPTLRASDLRLNAISQRDGRPLALINDHLVFEGDSFDGVRVVRIGETEVEVEIGGKRHVLRF
jgi:hypothetical protein